MNLSRLGPNLFGLVLLSFASVFEVILLVVCVPMFLFLPGPVSTVLFICGQVTIHLICYPMQGPSKIWSKTPMDPEMIAKYERVTGERWVFRNISMWFLALAGGCQVPARDSSLSQLTTIYSIARLSLTFMAGTAMIHAALSILS
jgi:hypothetical protein